MRSVNFTDDEIERIWQIVVAVLLLGNVEYDVDSSNDTAHIKEVSKPIIIKVAELLNLQDPEGFKVSLECKVTKVGREVIQSPYQLSGAISARNSAAKTLYGKLFNWIVSKVNENIHAKMESMSDIDHDHVNLLGILDIFGFESFKTNSFEQLCINYANEKLQ